MKHSKDLDEHHSPQEQMQKVRIYIDPNFKMSLSSITHSVHIDA